MSYTFPPSDFVSRFALGDTCQSCGTPFAVNDEVERLSFVYNQSEPGSVSRHAYHADCLRTLFEFAVASDKLAEECSAID